MPEVDDAVDFGAAESRPEHGIGFSGCDAELLSSFATQIKARGWLTSNQLPFARRKIRKYWKQLWQLAEQKAALKAAAVPVQGVLQ